VPAARAATAATFALRVSVVSVKRAPWTMRRPIATRRIAKRAAAPTQTASLTASTATRGPAIRRAASAVRNALTAHPMARPVAAPTFVVVSSADLGTAPTGAASGTSA
jgi:hypothetical protein